jgi:hypothetical protein
METLRDRLASWVDQVVVVDLRSPYVAIGRLVQVGHDYLELADADMHDLRDTDTNRELYVVKAARHGVQRNRAQLLIPERETAGVSRLADVVTG